MLGFGSSFDRQSMIVEPNFGITFYCVNVKDEHADVTLRQNASGSASYAVCTENGAQLVKLEPFL